MLKETNIQISCVVPKEIDEKLKKDAEKNMTTKNWVTRKILIEHYRNNGNE